MNNETKQTAVEWLETQIQDLIPNDIGSQLKFKNKIKQAKEIEKAQIKDAYNDGHTDGVEQKPGLTSGTIYYNETYGGNK